MGTDWERLAEMTDCEALAGTRSDADNPPLEDIGHARVIRMRDIPGGTVKEKLRNLREGWRPPKWTGGGSPSHGEPDSATGDPRG